MVGLKKGDRCGPAEPGWYWLGALGELVMDNETAGRGRGACALDAVRLIPALCLVAVTWNSALAADIHRLIGLKRSAPVPEQAEPPSVSAVRARAGRTGQPHTEPPSGDQGMRIERVPEEAFPTTWLVRTASGEIRAYCGHTADPVRSAVHSLERQTDRLLR